MRTLAHRDPSQKEEMPELPSESVQLANWLSDRIPKEACVDFPFQKLYDAFIDGKAIKLSVTPIPDTTKVNIELTIEHLD